MRLQLVFSIVLAVLLSSESQLLFAQPNPLTQWTYGNATFTYVSGLMDHTNVGGRPTVYLTNQAIGYSDIPLDPHGTGGAWIAVEFLDLTIREYALGEFWATMSCWVVGPYYGQCGGYLGTASLTSVDTVGGRVQGWIDFETDVLGYTVSAYGSFDVPYHLPTGIPVLKTLSRTPPEEFALHQNYPNPFNASTEIRFRISTRTFVTLSICDVRGTEVARLANEERSPGDHTVTWDATGVTSGTYFCRLLGGDVVLVRKMLLLQ